MQIIDEEKMASAQNIDIAHPPMKTVPDEFYPRLVYKHPKDKTLRTITQYEGTRQIEVVQVPEHKYKSVADEKAFKKAIAEGWKDKPYVHQFTEKELDADKYE